MSQGRKQGSVGGDDSDMMSASNSNVDDDGRLFNRTRPKSQGKVSSTGKEKKKSRKSGHKGKSTQKPAMDSSDIQGSGHASVKDTPLESVKLSQKQLSQDKAGTKEILEEQQDDSEIIKGSQLLIQSYDENVNGKPGWQQPPAIKTPVKQRRSS